jgi:hypothetical protein
VSKPATHLRVRNWLRISGFALGVATLVWLTVEDRDELAVLVISGLICTWGGIWLLARIDFPDRYFFWKHVVIGGGMGLLLVILALILMAVKTGVHGHGTPDYSVEQMRAVVSLSPFFLVGGSLVGAGAGLLRTTKMESSP